MRTACYRAVSSKLIVGGGRLREKSTADGRLREKKGRKRRGKEERRKKRRRRKNTSRRRRPRSGFFSRAGRKIDQGLNPVDPRFNFFLRALYPKEPSLALIEFLQVSLWLRFSIGAPDCASARGEYPTSRSSCSLPRSS
ncbi:hypothetical protein BHM03_00039989 [Ensete ventricosum]|nr:hypothetical protein BHM03_00039989 [Ensete ventricosum]